MNRNIDRISRRPRIWSNLELKKITPFCKGKIINVSAWKDEDKEGHFYKDYFIHSDKYIISNYRAEARGFQGVENEVYLDLTNDLPTELIEQYDVVFNHTTLEHIFNVEKAFYNLCQLSKDLVIVVVPFMQLMHGDYGDYWRFTPLCLKKMFEKNHLEMIYCNFNTEPNTSVYIFAVGSKKASSWIGIIPNVHKVGLGKPYKEEVAGFNVVKNPRTLASLINSIRSRLVS